MKTQELVNKVPVVRQSEEAQFINKTTETNFVRMTNHAKTEFAHITSNLKKLRFELPTKEIEACEKVMTRARGNVACLAPLLLLSDPRLAATGARGDALRKQLEASKNLIEANWKGYQASVPKWLMDRIYVALGVVPSSASGEAGAADGSEAGAADGGEEEPAA